MRGFRLIVIVLFYSRKVLADLVASLMVVGLGGSFREQEDCHEGTCENPH